MFVYCPNEVDEMLCNNLTKTDLGCMIVLEPICFDFILDFDNDILPLSRFTGVGSADGLST
mgnify:FL=1